MIKSIKQLFVLLRQNSLLSFFIKSVILYFILKTLFVAYIGATETGGTLYIPLLATYDFVQELRYSYIYPTDWIVSLMGYEAYAYKLGVTIPGPGGVQINNSCLGVQTMIVFFTLITCYPSQKNKVLHIVLGLGCIYILNLIRIVIVCISTTHSARVAELNHTIFNIVVYAFIICYFFFWTREKNQSI